MSTEFLRAPNPHCPVKEKVNSESNTVNDLAVPWELVNMVVKTFVAGIENYKQAETRPCIRDRDMKWVSSLTVFTNRV